MSVPGAISSPRPPVRRNWVTRETSSMEFQDKQLQCVDCGRDFIFTAGEQSFFQQKGLTNEPKRCRQCKVKQISQMPPESGPVSARIETPVTCSRCGRETTVPFVPKHGRPVLCRECFQARRSASL